MDKTRGRAYLVAVLLAVVLSVGICFPVVGKVAFAKEPTKENFVSIVHYIDVGQGDSTFIELPNNKTMLIDGGDYSHGTRVCDYIKSRGYLKINYLVATHSDSDHIGGLSFVLDEFEVENIFRPFVLSGAANLDDLEFAGIESSKIITENGEHYGEFIDKVYAEEFEGLPSSVYTLSNNMTDFSEDFLSQSFSFNVISPLASETKFTSITNRTSGYILQDKPEDENQISAVTLLTVGQNGFLFCADANAEAESKIINYVERADNIAIKEQIEKTKVIKVAHHGANTSTTKDFLDIVKPSVAVISVGIDNEFGHPSYETIERLQKYCTASNIFRTDFSGNIILKVSESGDIYSQVKIQKADKGIPDWALYLVFGVTILAIIVLTIFQLIRNKINKKNEQLTQSLSETPNSENLISNELTKTQLDHVEIREEATKTISKPKDPNMPVPKIAEPLKSTTIANVPKRAKKNEKIGHVKLLDVKDFFNKK